VVKIGSELLLMVPGRTIGQCCGRWRRKLGPTIDQSIDRVTARVGTWRPEDDAKLIEGGRELPTIGSELLHGFQVARIYSVAAGGASIWAVPSTWRPHVRWVSEQRKKTQKLLTHGGKNWPAVAAMVLGRPNRQCHVRWVEHVDPFLNIGR
jgi:hypothetical protein